VADAKAMRVDEGFVGARELAAYVALCVVLPLAIVAAALAWYGAFTRTTLPAGANLFRGDLAVSSSGAFPISNVSTFGGYNDPQTAGASGLIVRAAAAGTTKLGFENLDGTRIAVTAGQSYRISAVLFNVANGGSRLSLGIEWFDRHGKLVEDDSKPPAPIPARPTRIAETVVAPSGAARAIPFVRYSAPGPNEGFGVGNIEFKQKVSAPTG
jgi:hypothetical protein